MEHRSPNHSSAKRWLKVLGVALGQLQVEATLSDGELNLERMGAEVTGGRVDLAGTSVDLRRKVPRLELRTSFERVAARSLLAAFAGAANVLSGRARGALVLRASGLNWVQIAKTLTGEGSVALSEGTLGGANLGAQTQRPVAAALRQFSTPKDLIRRQITTFERLEAAFRFGNSRMNLERPLEMSTPFGRFELDGHIGLDGRPSDRDHGLSCRTGAGDGPPRASPAGR